MSATIVPLPSTAAVYSKLMQCAALLVAGCACLGAQPAALEGVVLNQATGQPMAGVHVRFCSTVNSGEGQPYGAITDRAGHFSIASLPAGTYNADAQQRGFFYMRPKEGRPLPRVSLKAGQRLTDFRIEMALGATIVGRVIDDNGDPVQASIRADAEPERAVNIGRRWDDDTDERGMFHLSVPPGRYYIVAEPGGRGMNQVPENRTDGIVEAIYGETYYPSSAAKTNAVLVEAVAGAELTGMDIRLARQPRRASIAGVVTGPAEVVSGSTVTLLQGDDPRHADLAGNIGVGPGGHFLFANLQPGTYRLVSWHRNDKTRLYSQPVDEHLEGDDVTNLKLALVPGGELTGKLEIVGRPSTESLSVGLEPIPWVNFAEAALSTEVNPSGVFRLAEIPPNHYRVQVTPMIENSYLKSVCLDGIEAPGGEVDLSRAAQGSSLKIVVSRNGGQVEGKLLDKNGEPVVAVPVSVLLVADPKEIDLERSLKTVKDGSYSFRGIRPGKYRLLAFDPDQLADVPDSLETVGKLAAAAEEIEIKEGDRKVKDLKLLVTEDTDAKPSQ